MKSIQLLVTLTGKRILCSDDVHKRRGRMDSQEMPPLFMVYYRTGLSAPNVMHHHLEEANDGNWDQSCMHSGSHTFFDFENHTSYMKRLIGRQVDDAIYGCFVDG